MTLVPVAEEVGEHAMDYFVGLEEVAPAPIAGPNWEVYTHWEEDPAKLRTEVYYLLG